MDLELSVFFDTPPKLAVKDLDTAIPTHIRIEDVQSVNDILKRCDELVDQFGIKGSELVIPTFTNLFQRFLERDVNEGNPGITPQQLRILLHGLQGLASHLYECMVSLFHFGSRFYVDHLTASFGSRALLQELKSLLQYWYLLYRNSIQGIADQDFCLSQTLIIYHLMSARVLLSFEELEYLARNDPAKEFFKKLPRVQKRLIEEGPNVNFHCGQIIRLIRSLPQDRKPAWWAAGELYIDSLRKCLDQIH